MSQLPVEEALKDLPRTEETKRRVLEWMHSMGSDSPASNEHGNPSGSDLEGEIDHTRLRPRNGAELVISAKVSIVAARKRHHLPAKAPKGPTASHGGPPCLSQGLIASQRGSDDARDGTVAKREVMIPLVRNPQSHQLTRLKRG